MELTKISDIQEYAKRNTSPKMPIEGKYVESYTDAILNSTSVIDKYNEIQSKCCNGDLFYLFSSLSKECAYINKSNLRPIVAYSMIKKDIELFRMISRELFTGRVVEYHGMYGFYSTEIAENTDEVPEKYTDSGIYTDIGGSFTKIAFINTYCDDPLDDGHGSEFQNLESLNSSIEDYEHLIVIVKPARINAFLFFEKYCYIGYDDNGTSYPKLVCGCDIVASPFGDATQMSIIKNMTTTELISCYKEIKPKTELKSFVYSKSYTVTDSCITLTYHIECDNDGTHDNVWDVLSIPSSNENLNDIKFKPKEVLKQDMAQHYFALIEVSFPRA